jgi:hypothetical protein
MSRAEHSATNIQRSMRSVDIISLTPRFKAVNNARAQEQPFKRLFSAPYRMHPAEAVC